MMPTIRMLPSEVETWIAERATAPRSEGHHVSDVLVAMLQRLRPVKYEDWGQGADREPRYEAGFLWEDILSEALSRRLLTEKTHQLLPPMELRSGNLIGTPDRILVPLTSTGDIIIEESKFTIMSVRKAEGTDSANPDPKRLLEEVDFRYWVWQARTYAALLYAHYAVWYQLLHPAIPKLVRFDKTDYPWNMGMRQRPPLVRIRALFVAQRERMAVPLCWELAYTAEELTSWLETVHRFIAEELTDVHAPEPA